MAVDDDLILKNPFGFELGTILVNDSQKREAVSLEDETRFLEFVTGVGRPPINGFANMNPPVTSGEFTHI